MNAAEKQPARTHCGAFPRIHCADGACTKWVCSSCGVVVANWAKRAKP